MDVHVASTGEKRNMFTISTGKPERKRKNLTVWEQKMKIILKRNFEKYDRIVEVDYSQFYARQLPVVVSLESGEMTHWFALGKVNFLPR